MLFAFYKMVNRSPGNGEQNNTIQSMYRLDKIAIAVFLSLVTFMFTQIWVLNGKINELEIKLAETRGQISGMTQTMNTLMEKGSLPTQRMEVMVTTILNRLERMEQRLDKNGR